jgi:hypothetical protein
LPLKENDEQQLQSWLDSLALGLIAFLMPRPSSKGEPREELSKAIAIIERTKSPPLVQEKENEAGATPFPGRIDADADIVAGTGTCLLRLVE